MILLYFDFIYHDFDFNSHFHNTIFFFSISYEFFSASWEISSIFTSKTTIAILTSGIICLISKIFVDVLSPSRVQLFVTPWIATQQASLSLIISQSLLKLMSAESVMPSSHLILCCPLLQLGPMDELSKQPLLFCYGCSWCENDLLCTTVPL